MPGASVSAKPRKEMKTLSSTQRYFGLQRLGSARRRSLWVRGGMSQGGFGSSVNSGMQVQQQFLAFNFQDRKLE